MSQQPHPDRRQLSGVDEINAQLADVAWSGRKPVGPRPPAWATLSAVLDAQATSIQHRVLGGTYSPEQIATALAALAPLDDDEGEQRSGAGSVNIRAGGNVTINGDIHVAPRRRRRRKGDTAPPVHPSDLAITRRARAREAEVKARRVLRRAESEVVTTALNRSQAVRNAVIKAIVLLAAAAFVGYGLGAIPAIVVILFAGLALCRGIQAGQALERRGRSLTAIAADAAEDHALALELVMDLEAAEGGPGELAPPTV